MISRGKEGFLELQREHDFVNLFFSSPLWKKLFRKIFAKLGIQVFNLAAAGCLKITQRPLNRNQRYYKTNLILFNNPLNLYFSVVFMIISQIKKKSREN